MSRKYEATGPEAEFEPGSRGRVLRNLLGINRVRDMNETEAQALELAQEAALDQYGPDHRSSSRWCATPCTKRTSWCRIPSVSWLTSRHGWRSRKPLPPLPRAEEGQGGGGRFTDEQRWWLEKMAEHIASNLGIEADDFGYAPFDQRGGLGKVHQLFGAELHTLLTSLSDALAA